MINKVIVLGNNYTIMYSSRKVSGFSGNYRENKEVQAWIAEGNKPEQYVEPEPTYAELRQAEYPSLAEQQDMQYWDVVNGTSVWLDTITAIKEKYPKPAII